VKAAILAIFAALLAAPAVPQTPAPAAPLPPRHVLPWPALGSGDTPAMVSASLAMGPELNRGGSARELLADRRALEAALDAIKPQRSGTVDAFVVTVALDSDPVFGREAREAGLVLARRYGAQERVITLAGPIGRGDALPRGSPTSLTLALAHVAELMDPAEDILVLYSTSHGTREGLAYHYGDSGYGIVSPLRLRSILGELGIERRIVLLSACYSGVFLPTSRGRTPHLLPPPRPRHLRSAAARTMTGPFSETRSSTMPCANRRSWRPRCRRRRRRSPDGRRA
jgi:hypothetical protein